ncbi:hypothetical protein [Haloprofundus sp. MHR1]|uniref:hypothetical protein n=1 Tax=Haloprofundus sp. MHR1 TaxID=2572921 RepID=UPI0010BF25C0|nr:hypothetical protein [Haloprofundus sp. MHR1]QCJ48055.1 hypothetical protein FCF25_13405 [Haloprofundus sp. MHR1]
MRVPPPAVPEDRLDGWRQVESSVEHPFDAGLVRVTAHTVVYENATFAERLPRRPGATPIRRFFFASRLRLAPKPPASRTLFRLVADRSMAGFETKLRERGFLAVDRASERRFDVRGTEARLAGYDARTRVGGAVVGVRGWLAAWPTDARGEFLLAGGAYPTNVAEDDSMGVDAGRSPSLADAFDPERFREELFALIRATR